MHPRIRDEVLSDFLRGDYESVVFKAFKAVEVEVRGAAQLSSDDIGVPLMRKASDPGGPLEDAAATAGEREALAHLFTGAMGVMKNPPSHRYTRGRRPEGRCRADHAGKPSPADRHPTIIGFEVRRAEVYARMSTDKQSERSP